MRTIQKCPHGGVVSPKTDRVMRSGIMDDKKEGDFVSHLTRFQRNCKYCHFNVDCFSFDRLLQ